MNIEEEKEKLRKQMKKRLADQAAHERWQKSEAITRKLEKDARFGKARTLMVYVSIEGEVETQELLRRASAHGKQVAVPSVNSALRELKPSFLHDFDRDLTPGSYGILEPKPECIRPVELSAIDLVLVPGLAFDQANFRLGRGGGYYDRFLARLPRHVVTYGLAFDFQIVKSLPVTELDIPVNRVFHN